MTTVFLVLLAGTLITLFEWKTFKKQKNSADIAVFAVLLIAGMTLGILWGLDYTLPQPLKLLEYLFKPISNWINKILA